MSASACGRCSTSTTSAGSATTSGSPTASISTATSACGWRRPARGSRTARLPTAGWAPASRPCPHCCAPARPSGLGVDGAASNESGELLDELRAALILGRAKAGPTALTVRQSLELATSHGARCLGREDELGHLSEGALADIALWDLRSAGHAGHRRSGGSARPRPAAPGRHAARQRAAGRRGRRAAHRRRRDARQRARTGQRADG